MVEILGLRMENPTIKEQFPGITTESTKVLHDLLQRNHDSHHCFFNDAKFHNHLTHHLVSAYFFGARPERLHEVYKQHAVYQRQMPPRHKEPMTDATWTQHLGKVDFYADFLDFFDKQIESHGVVDTLSKYAFDDSLFNRTFSGALHPFIHFGNGVEFGSPLLVAEGLSMAAVTSPTFKTLLTPPEKSAAVPKALEDLSLSDKTAYGVIQQMAADPRFDGMIKYTDGNKSNALIAAGGDKIVAEHAYSYVIKAEAEDIDRKMQEVYHLSALVYGATGVRGNFQHFITPHLDFFLMHGLTSAAFLPPLVNLLKPKHSDLAAKLLHAHFTVLAWYYVARNRPKLSLPALLNFEPQHHKVNKANPWLGYIEGALLTSEEHQSKVLRALYRGEALWGQGHSSTIEQPGDSKVWEAAALVTVDTIAGVPGSTATQTWDFHAIGFEEAWEQDNPAGSTGAQDLSRSMYPKHLIARCQGVMQEESKGLACWTIAPCPAVKPHRCFT